LGASPHPSCAEIPPKFIWKDEGASLAGYSVSA
jgi:hypothetical protein